MSMRSGLLTAAAVAVCACVLVGCGKRADDELARELWARTSREHLTLAQAWANLTDWEKALYEWSAKMREMMR